MTIRASRRFQGFLEGKTASVTLPEVVFTELIPSIDDLHELKLLLLILWQLTRQQSDLAPWVTVPELWSNPVVRSAFPDENTPQALVEGMEQLVERGVLLGVDVRLADGSLEQRFLANSPRGRAAVAALQRGVVPQRALSSRPPGIFTLYEETIGPLTALLSEELMEAESLYPASWIQEAFLEAARLNKRNWKYIRAILERWRVEGRDEIDRGDRESDTRRYIEGEYGQLIQH